MAAVELHAGGGEEARGVKVRVRSSELTPAFGKAGELGVAMIEEHGQLLRRERVEWSSVRLGPPAKLPLREPLQA